MIKGGGGALSKEKILIYAAKKVIIIADSSKFVDAFNRTIPIEVHQFARSFVGRKLYEIGTAPTLRTLEKGYPYITESGNIIFDTQFGSFKDPQRREIEVKSIPGVLEVGLFTRRADVYYKAKFDGSFETLMF
jgi:ribose 5-phosphate isomerase A